MNYEKQLHTHCIPVISLFLLQFTVYIDFVLYCIFSWEIQLHQALNLLTLESYPESSLTPKHLGTAMGSNTVVKIGVTFIKPCPLNLPSLWHVENAHVSHLDLIWHNNMTPSQNEMTLHGLSEFCNRLPPATILRILGFFFFFFWVHILPGEMCRWPYNLPHLWSCSDTQHALNQLWRSFVKFVYFIQNLWVLEIVFTGRSEDV